MTPDVAPFFHAGSNTWLCRLRPGVATGRHHRSVLDFDMASGRTSYPRPSAAVACPHAPLDALVETHAHADHLSSGHWLKQRIPGATLAIGEGIRTVQKTFRPIFNLGEHFPVDGSQFDRLFADGDSFAIGSIDARVIAVPGHTSDSNAYLIGDALFTGDSLFMPDGGTARCDFPGGSAAQLYRSIQRMYALPDDTRVFVCHDYGPGGRDVACETTIGEQKRGNIHVREGVSESDFVAVREARDRTLSMALIIRRCRPTSAPANCLPPKTTARATSRSADTL